jgi:tetratricopeptide (TPR) repeat protein
MYSIQFWKHWQGPYRFLFWVLSCLFLIAIVLLWRGYFLYPAPVITLDHYQQLQSIETLSHSFSLGLINLAVPAESHLIFESILGSNLHPNVFTFYFFLTLLGVSFTFFISISTNVSRYRFLMSMAIAILFLASLQLDALEVFGLQNQAITIGAILLYVFFAFYFHALRTAASFLERLLTFSVLTVLIGVVISFFSKTTGPLLHLSANGLLAGIIISLIFMLVVAHEIVAVFVTVITRSLKSEKSLQHFLILTSIYLVNVFLMFASKMGIIEWGFFSVSPFFLFTLSAVLGIWGFKQRQADHEDILNDEPQRIYFFFSLALTSLGALTFFVSSASDMMMDALEDYIIATHFGVGIIFMLYIVANFAPMLVKNLPVYKVLYKPETMPLFTFRIMAIIATFAVLSWAVSWKTYLNQIVATYYHAQGDLYLAQDDDKAAETFYLKSLRFRNQNLHAHYALASIYSNRFESIKERKEYERAITWSPSVPLYLNLAQSYNSRGDLVEAALTLDDGKRKFPKSGEILNAVGLSFLKLKSADSALFFLKKAEQVGETKSIAEANVFSANAWFNTNQPVDSIVSIQDSHHSAIAANQLAMANLKRQRLTIEGAFSNDTILTAHQAMTLCNYLINQKESVDTTLIRNAINLSRKRVNEDFAEQLLIASAHALYAQGLITEALQIVRETAFSSGEPNYFLILGLWLLEQNNPGLAATYFHMAADRKPVDLYYEAIAQLENENLEQASASCDSLRKSTDKIVVAWTEKMIRVLNTKPEQVGTLADEEKYYFCRYKISTEDKKSFERVIGMIADERLRAQALVDRSKKLFSVDEVNEASTLLNQLQTSSKQIANLKLMLAASRGDWQFVEGNFEKTEVTPTQRVYFEALLAAKDVKQKTAADKFGHLAKSDNQFEEGIVAAARYFALGKGNQLENFSNVVEGLIAKPYSVKILKQHALMAAELGFTDASQDSLDKLQALLPPETFRKFVEGYPDYFRKN